MALAAGLRLVPVLFDHTLAFHATEMAGARVGGHRAWLADPEGQSRLLDTVVAPLARRYGARGTHAHLGRAIYAWDLLNEPDWLVTELYPTRRATAMPFDVLAAWMRDAAGELHRHEAGLVTIGGARLRFAPWWDDPRLGLDFLQAHAYYDPAHDLDLLRTPHRALGLTRPVVHRRVLGPGRCRRCGRRAAAPAGAWMWPTPRCSAATPARGRGPGAAWTPMAPSAPRRCAPSPR